MTRLTKYEAQKRVDEIRAMAAIGDNEAAHVLEDGLLFMFVCDVRDGGDAYEIKAIAEILSTIKEIDYVRHCA